MASARSSKGFAACRIARQRPLDAKVEEARRQVRMCGTMHFLSDRHGPLGELRLLLVLTFDERRMARPSRSRTSATSRTSRPMVLSTLANSARATFSASMPLPRSRSSVIICREAGESRDRRGGLDAGCLRGRSGRMATDQRGIDDEQSTQEGDQRSKRRTLENRLAAFAAGGGHQFSLMPSWISRGGRVLVIWPNPLNPTFRTLRPRRRTQ